MSLTFKYYLFTKQLADLVVLKTHARFGLATDNTPRLHRCFISLTWDHFQNSRARQESHSPMPGTQPVSQHWVNMTHSESKLQDTKHLVFSLSFSLSLFQCLSISLSLSEKYGCSGIMGTESIGKSPKRAKVYVWACEKERESRLDLFRPGCMCAEHWPSLVLASDVKGSNSIAAF